MITIFLDIDGVINNENPNAEMYHHFSPYGHIGYMEAILIRLSQFLSEIEAKLIITSTWRFDMIFDTEDGEFMKDAFERHGICIDGYLDILADESLRFETIEDMMDKKCVLFCT